MKSSLLTFLALAVVAQAVERPNVLWLTLEDTSPQFTRSVTDGRYVYSRHFLPGPELRYAKYFEVGDIVRLLRADFEQGTLNEVQASMMRSQPHEVLYDLETDPWETRNLDDFPYPPARIEFAAALYGHDGNLAAAEVLNDYAHSENPHLRLHALQRIQEFGPRARPFIQVLERCLKGGTYDTRCSAEVTLHLLDGRDLSHAN